MDYVAPLGIPYRSFIDEWDPYSQAAALAWKLRENDRCGGCHQPRSEWLDENGVEKLVRPAVLEEDYCPSCRDLEVAQERLAEERKKAPRHGWSLIWKRNQTQEDDDAVDDSAA